MPENYIDKIKKGELLYNLKDIDAAHIINIGSTDVTSVFDQIKTGDMINQNNTQLYIVIRVNDNEISLFFINYENDELGYYFYSKEENIWRIQSSFGIDESSLGGGTKLYYHKFTLGQGQYGNLGVISTQSTPLKISTQGGPARLLNITRDKILMFDTSGLQGDDAQICNIVTSIYGSDLILTLYYINSSNTKASKTNIFTDGVATVTPL